MDIIYSYFFFWGRRNCALSRELGRVDARCFQLVRACGKQVASLPQAAKKTVPGMNENVCGSRSAQTGRAALPCSSHFFLQFLS